MRLQGEIPSQKQFFQGILMFHDAQIKWMLQTGEEQVGPELSQLKTAVIAN